MTNDYTQITWLEVRKGDVLLHENGDRLTVESATYANLTGGTFRVTVATRAFGIDELERIGFSPYRRKPELPKEPGAYLDKDGGLCVLDNSGSEHCWWDFADAETPCYTRDEISHRAPFTRLVPMPSSDAVLDDVREAAWDEGYDYRTVEYRQHEEERVNPYRKAVR